MALFIKAKYVCQIRIIIDMFYYSYVFFLFQLNDSDWYIWVVSKILLKLECTNIKRGDNPMQTLKTLSPNTDHCQIYKEEKTAIKTIH